MKKLTTPPYPQNSEFDDIPYELRGREPAPMFIVVKSSNSQSLKKLALFINQNSKTFTENPMQPAITNASLDIFTGVFTSCWRAESIVNYLIGEFAGYTELKKLSSPFNAQTDTLLILPIGESPAAYTTSTLASWLRHHCAPARK